MEAGGTTRHCTEVNRQPSPCGIASARRRPWRHHRWGTDRDFPHSTRFSGKGYHRSSKASRREDLEVEEPVACGHCSSFHFHAALAGMLGPTLIGDHGSVPIELTGCEFYTPQNRLKLMSV